MENFRPLPHLQRRAPLFVGSRLTDPLQMLELLPDYSMQNGNEYIKLVPTPMHGVDTRIKASAFRLSLLIKNGFNFHEVPAQSYANFDDRIKFVENSLSSLSDLTAQLKADASNVQSQSAE